MEKTNEMHTAQSDFMPFDPIILIQDVLKRWLVILLAVIVVGAGTYIVTDMTYEPVYRTTTTFVVTTRSSASTVYTNLSSTTSLATVFEELLNSSILRKSILAEIGESSFDGTISASVISETNLINVTVSASDPRTAFLVAQAIIDHHESVTYQVVDNIALEVLQSPTVPSAPVNHADAEGQMKKMMVLTAAGMAALLLVLSYMQDTVRSGKEAHTKLDGSCLGEIPHENKYKTLLSLLRRQKTGILITNPTTSFRFLESIRKLRRRLEQRLHGRKVLMVTSLLENEGKSTVAVNLALALAQKHQRVLLIDCDLRKPACHILMEQRGVPHGLRDVLTEKSPLEEAVVQDKKSGLYMLLEPRSSGSSDPVTSARMKELVRWAKAEFDYVVLDLPPMAEVSDAESVSEFADASILVVRQNAAVAPALNKAIAALNGGKSKFLGCVLNNVYTSVLTSGHGYGYGHGGYRKYGYGHYGANTTNDGRQ